MTEPEPLDLNRLQADDVTIPSPDLPSPPSVDSPGGTPRRAWRQRTPRKTPPPKAPKTPPIGIPRPKRGTFTAPLTQTYTSVGLILMPIDPVCANLFIVNAKDVAKAWDDAAYESDAVRVFLTNFMRTSIATRIAIAHVPILMGMMLHHSARAQNILRQMGEGFAETVENNMRAGDMGNGIPEE